MKKVLFLVNYFFELDYGQKKIKGLFLFLDFLEN